MLNKNDKVALVVCSNGKSIEDKERLVRLEKLLLDIGLVPIFSKFIYKDKFGRSTAAQVRAAELMKFYKDSDIKAIFDISGGDLANEVLTYLDYDIIKKYNKPFVGYSDLTTVLNALITKTSHSTYLYQILNIIENNEIYFDFIETFLKGSSHLFDVEWQVLQGDKIEGIVVGGNIRCFLKLAGTEYFPNLDNKILFIEGLGTTIEALITHLTQLSQIGAFKKVNGILLGTFTNIEKNYSVDDIYNVVKDFVPKQLPIAKTQQIGHSKYSKMLILGKNIKITK